MSKLFFSSYPHCTTFSNNLMDLHYVANAENVRTQDINLCQVSQSFLIYALVAPPIVKQDWTLDINFALDPKPGAYPLCCTFL